MGRWSELARKYDTDPVTLTDNRPKPAKRVQSVENKGFGKSEPNRQKPAETPEQNQAGDFLPLSAATSGDDETPANKAAQTFLPVSAMCRRVDTVKEREPPQQSPNPGPVPDKVGVGGRPVTWTGKIVNLDEWRRLTDWERHGPNGRMWNGKTQQWEQAE